MSRDRPDPSEMHPREAANRYLRRRQADSTEKSIHGWRYRLKLFVEWCESVGIEKIGQLQAYDVDEWYDVRSADVAPATLEGDMWTLKMFCRYLEDLDAVEDGVAESVRIPDLDPEDRSNDVKLRAEDAAALMEYYRNADREYGSRQHAFLELAWTTGARLGGLVALDVRDFYPAEQFVEFRYRPPETPLKNKLRGERPVAIPQETVDAVDHYIRNHRYDVHDDDGRQPLLASAKGRPGTNTVRVWSYLATIPCTYTECPHGKDAETCEWTQYAHASKCPSSRSPHQIRTGVITSLLNQGWPPEDVAERVNSSVKTIEQHYDKADPEQRRQRLRDRMEDRRSLIDKTEFINAE